ncbi:MaoC family dehydratase [Dietzia psychralcaliphila]|uniref:Acyl dehydratase n=1 Tax=Dietzia psychralcaliphila TaxID=139021 RepID=A0AAD0NMX5_9ACTN|nr:MaoC family dehydratase [Dietzia psychralcaliphila]AWH95875.1 acyl dehydratase [Dietzia psychralcaliphila]PTM85692.1 acyl dehydratase [Dietzia psychralcaliphila]
MDRSDAGPVGGPYFDELTVGQVVTDAPSVTLTEGLAAAHQAILGDRLRLPLDHHLAHAVTGGTVAHPGLVTDVAIGQSTVITQRVRANLFYRGLRLFTAPRIGDTVTTRTEVVGLKSTTSRPGRAATGLAALRVTTTDQDGRTVLDFHRCAMVPLAPGVDPESCAHADDLSVIGAGAARPWAAPGGWDLAAYRSAVPGAGDTLPAEGSVLRPGADVVSSAPELARLTMNIAQTHHDARVSGTGRLVYGGHTIGLALSQATRALPAMVTVLGWHSCDHLGPVREGDTLSSELVVGAAVGLAGGGTALDLRSLVTAHRADGEAPVLDWTYTVLMACDGGRG